MCTSEERINAYLEKIGYDEPISREEFKKAVEGAIQARALIFYFVYKFRRKVGNRPLEGICHSTGHCFEFDGLL